MEGEAILRALEREFMEDVAARGIDAWVERFGEDGAMLGLSGSFIGSGPIRDRMRRTFSLPDISIEWHPDVACMAEDLSLGFTSGPSRFSWTADGKTEFREGRYLTVWRRNDKGGYEIVVDAPIA
jgi:ketosteroid isomerase-like protein